MDRATYLSLEYLKIIEERLGISWNDLGNPVYVFGHVNTFTYRRLTNDIGELFCGNTLDNAIVDCRAFGRERVQTVGFGFVEDFDKFVKMGFLCGERLILWDFFWGRILQSADQTPIAEELLAQVACELLLIKPIVQAGALVILPHPTHWSEKAYNYVAELASTEHMNAANFGLVSTLSILEEIQLHPYTLFSGHSRDWPLHPEGLRDNRYFSEEQYALHRTIDDLFKDVRFAYLNDVSAATFYQIIANHNSVQEELRRLVGPLDRGWSPQQIAAHSKGFRDRLDNLINDQNKVVLKAAALRMGSGVSFVGALPTMLHSLAVNEPRSLVAASLLSLSGGLLQFMASILTRQNRVVLVNAFHEIRGVASEYPPLNYYGSDTNEA